MPTELDEAKANSRARNRKHKQALSAQRKQNGLNTRTGKPLKTARELHDDAYYRWYHGRQGEVHRANNPDKKYHVPDDPEITFHMLDEPYVLTPEELARIDAIVAGYDAWDNLTTRELSA